MAKVPAAVTPDLTEDEKVYIEKHPWMRPLLIVVRIALVPAGMAVMAGYFQYRSSADDKKTDATYQAVAPALDETQKQVKALTEKVDLLQQLILAVAKNGGAAAPVTTTPSSTGTGHFGTGHVTVEVDVPHPAPLAPKPPAVAKAELVKKLEQVKARHYDAKPLPKSANDALEQMAR